ncbi:sulfur carrier protein ThiS [mine drainage metagenome]|uniref:Sulfur carrier protein ThiS n=1 Tax=mine drainage metagenome TaxID=410659 RepID=A0A1J5SVE4_9ZZZZ
MMVKVNGVPSETAEGATIASLLVDLGLAESKGIAVAVNGIVTARAEWTMCRLEPGDDVLVIRATQGG